MKYINKDNVIMSVSEFSILCGIWGDRLPDLLGKTITVVNSKKKEIIARFLVMKPQSKWVSDIKQKPEVSEDGSIIFRKGRIWDK